MRKIFISLLLSLTVVFAHTISINANTNLENKIEKLAEKYGFELIELPSDTDFIKVKDLNDLENYLKQLKNQKKDLEYKKKVKYPISAKSNGEAIIMGTVGPIIEDSHLWHWWNPFADFDGVEVLSWSNVYSEYSYTWYNGNPMVYSYDKSSIESWISGTQLSWWDQVGTVPYITTTHNYNDTYKIKVSGRYVLGVEIAGLTIGFSRNDTWNVSLILV